MRVLVVGDVHGRHRELIAVLRQAQADYRVAAAIQVGDFGFNREAIRRLSADTGPFPVPLHVIDGNHEDHRWLRRAVLTGAAGAWRGNLNLYFQSRSSVVRFGSSQVGFIGGALTADRPQHHNLLGGFPNYIRRRQRQHAATLFNREQPELIVTHSCPSGIGLGLRGSPGLERDVAEHIAAAGFDPGPRDDCGEAELSRLWADLRYRPRAWVFGHFHRNHQALIEGTRFICVADDLASPQRLLAIWDTEEKLLLRCPADPSR